MCERCARTLVNRDRLCGGGRREIASSRADDCGKIRFAEHPRADQRGCALQRACTRRIGRVVRVRARADVDPFPAAPRVDEQHADVRLLQLRSDRLRRRRALAVGEHDGKTAPGRKEVPVGEVSQRVEAARALREHRRRWPLDPDGFGHSSRENRVTACREQRRQKPVGHRSDADADPGHAPAQLEREPLRAFEPAPRTRPG